MQEFRGYKEATIERRSPSCLGGWTASQIAAGWFLPRSPIVSRLGSLVFHSTTRRRPISFMFGTLRDSIVQSDTIARKFSAALHQVVQRMILCFHGRPDQATCLELSRRNVCRRSSLSMIAPSTYGIKTPRSRMSLFRRYRYVRYLKLRY